MAGCEVGHMFTLAREHPINSCGEMVSLVLAMH